MYLARGNPQILEVKEDDGVSISNKLNMKEKGFRFAWAFEGSWDRDLKDDPRYVKQYVRVAGRKAGKSFATLLDFHKCTEEELAEFPNPTADTRWTLNKIRNDPKRGLHCLNWDQLDDELDIFGINTYDDFQYMDIDLVPCQMMHYWGGVTNDSIHPDCIYDKEQ